MNRLDVEIFAAGTDEARPWTLFRRVADDSARFIDCEQILVFEDDPGRKLLRPDEWRICGCRIAAVGNWIVEFDVIIFSVACLVEAGVRQCVLSEIWAIDSND